jgi:hypothetical protein
MKRLGMAITKIYYILKKSHWMSSGKSNPSNK